MTVMKNKIIKTESVENTWKVAEDFTNLCNNIKRKRALIVALKGDLGSGKTTFTQGVAKALGIKQKITSPTFVIMKKYKISLRSSVVSSQKKLKNLKTQDLILNTLVHIDAYRLKIGEDLKVLGWSEIIKNPKNIVLIEWPENVKEAMPKKYVKVEFKHNGGDERKINIKNIKDFCFN